MKRREKIAWCTGIRIEAVFGVHAVRSDVLAQILPRLVLARIGHDDHVVDSIRYRILSFQIDPSGEAHQAILEKFPTTFAQNIFLSPPNLTTRRASLTAIFFTSKECSVAEQTIICKRLASIVILGVRLCSRLIKSPCPCCSRPSASSRIKKRQ